MFDEVNTRQLSSLQHRFTTPRDLIVSVGENMSKALPEAEEKLNLLSRCDGVCVLEFPEAAS
jgi:hypothetical protein